MSALFAWTDGACSGNPGPGGWGVLMRAMEGEQIVKERELQGGEADTTNNRMELMAAISALEVLTRPSEITIITTTTGLTPSSSATPTPAGTATASAQASSHRIAR